MTARDKILIVEKSVSICEMLERHLRHCGWRVRQELNPRSIFERDLARDAAVLITASQLEEFNGIDLIRQLRSDHPDMAAILLLRYDDPFPMTRQQFVGLPLVGVLHKPITIESAERLVRRGFPWNAHPELRVMLSVFAEMEVLGLVGS